MTHRSHQNPRGDRSHLRARSRMKVIIWAPCVALHLVGVRGFQAGDALRAPHWRSSSLRLGSARHTGCPRSLPVSTVARHEPVSAGTTMKLEVESASDQTDSERYRSALTTTALAVTGGTAFGAGINQVMGAEKAVQFFAGYVVELSLSVDNLFVFLLLFKFFQVPLPIQNRVLSWGIFGAVVMRALFIAAGEAAMSVFHPVLLAFAGVLVFSSYKLWVEEDGDGDDDLSDNVIVAFASQFLDATESYDGDNFFTTVDGLRRATPLLLVLICIELSDVVFAVDSIPAVFAVTKDPFIVYTSNIWAILNLRSMFTLLANAVEDLPYLRPAVAIVLGFVGVKLGAEFFGFDISTGLSLGIIAGILGSAVGLSVLGRQDTR